MLTTLTRSMVLACALGLAASHAAALPAYRIVSEDGEPAALSVAVRLEARQAEADLRAIADDVRARLPAQKIVRNVAFYLPADALSDAPWADVRLAGDPVVTIAGLRLDEEQAYRAEAQGDRRRRIGVWLTEPPALPGRLIIYRDAAGKPFAEWRLRNGQKTTDAVDEIKTNRGRRFVVIDGDGSYFQMVSQGRLELGADGRMIAIAEPLAVLPPAKGEPQAALPVTAAAPQSAAATVTSHAADAELHGPRPAVRRAPRSKPAMRHATATANDAISGALSR